jgi:dimethylhistidine N-methyltransferase
MELQIAQTAFRTDIIKGLSSPQKFLLPKYFYNTEGDKIFQQIMQSPEYYITGAEDEILTYQSHDILKTSMQLFPTFDIVELGAGDATKTIHLLQEAVRLGTSNHYYPIDISRNTIDYLHTALPSLVPGMQIRGLEGEYISMLQQVPLTKPKLVLFLGANIGNMLPDEALAFCKRILNKGDMLLTGFDLKKDPQKILAAYNDKEGFTKAFNLNLLMRINDELGADFNTANFTHYPMYDPVTGACKSYLISRIKQEVTLDDGTTFKFEKDEPVYMEVSQKYSEKEIDKIAIQAGFKTIHSFYDSNHLFVDTLWQKL